MKKLFQEEKDDDKRSNAFLFLENGYTLNIHAEGKHGIFYGYLTFIDGDFSMQELQCVFDEKQFFVSDNVNIDVSDINVNKHIIVIGSSFFYFNSDKNNLEKHNITLIDGISSEKIKAILPEELCCKNNIRCAIYFPNVASTNNIENNRIIESLSQMKQLIYDVNLLSEYRFFKPYYVNSTNNHKMQYFKHYSILKDTKTIALVDFGISKLLCEILTSYFNIILLPYTETFKHIKYLYEDRKIDGVVLSDFICNTDFISESVRLEIKNLLQSNIPVLALGASSIFIAELFNSKTYISDDIFNIGNYDIENIHHKQYKMTNFYFKKIDILSEQLRAKYFDKNVNIVGFESKNNNIIGYNFIFTHNNLDVAFFLNEFWKKIKYAKR